MSRCNLRSLVLAAAAALAVAVPATGQVATSQPIKIKVKTPKKKLEKFKGEVLNATPVAITVRSRDNYRLIRTFRYSTKVKEKITKILNQGGYQYGDKVEIQSEPGSDVALRIKGKPSKPL